MNIYNLPVPERIERIIGRLNRRVYHRLTGDYAGGGHNLFNENKLIHDLGVSHEDYRELLGATREDYGWNLPVAPTAEMLRDSIPVIQACEMRSRAIHARRLALQKASC